MLDLTHSSLCQKRRVYPYKFNILLAVLRSDTTSAHPNSSIFHQCQETCSTFHHWATETYWLGQIFWSKWRNTKQCMRSHSSHKGTKMVIEMHSFLLFMYGLHRWRSESLPSSYFVFMIQQWALHIKVIFGVKFLSLFSLFPKQAY